MSALHEHSVASHRFAVGHVVRFSMGPPLRNAAGGTYDVLAQLPARNGEFQYVIKSDREIYQRVANEGELKTA